MKTLTLFTAIILAVCTATAQVINIPADYPTIQDGINAAVGGDTVLVQPGTYFENINFKGKAITVASNYLISPDSAYIFNTIIDGSQPSHPDSASVVMFITTEDTTSVLCGFTITGGTGFIYPSIYQRGGGGIVGMASGATIKNNIIINNSLENDTRASGGGISFLGGTSETWVIIKDNIIKSNEVTDPISAFGGGIYVSSHCRIERNIIDNNACNSTTGWSEGGGIEFQDIFNNGFQLILKNNIIKGNSLDGKWVRGGGIAYISGAGKSIFAHYTRQNPLPPLSEILGNVITYNEINADLYHYGAGIYIYRPVTDFNIISNDVSFNSSEGNEYVYGSGIFMSYSENHKVYIGNNKIESNMAVEGGGLFIQNAYNLQVNNNLFYDNTAYDYGGAIRLLQYNGKKIYTEKTVYLNEDNKIEWNSRRDNELIYSNNTFVNNSAETGGAVYVKNEPYSPIICNSIFWGNTTPSGIGKDITVATESTAILNNNDIDSAAVEGTWIGTENIFGNPIFVNSGDHPYQINDYSPCIDAGTPDTTGLNLPEDDLAGEPRIDNDRVDMGAYEWNMMVGVEVTVYSDPKSGILSYPNPFTISTTIEYKLQQPATVEIAIYDYLGKQVAGFAPGSQGQGRHTFSWQTRNLPAGIYYCVLKTECGTQSTKMIKLK